MSFQTAFSSLITKIENNFAYLKNRIDNATGLTIDQIFDGTSQNAQSGAAIQGELSNYAKSVNNNQPDVNGNISLSIPSISGLADINLSNLSATGKTVIDGQWTGQYSQVATNTAVNSYTHNLSSYLPNDGHDYEVFVSIQATYGSANGYLSVGAVASPYSNAGSAGCYLTYAAATGYSRSNALTAIIPVKASNKNIYSQITGGALGSSYIRLYGYRRIGSNT